MEQYYLIVRIKNRFMIDAFNIHVIKQKKGELEMLTSEVIKPKEIGIKLDETGKICCTDNKYKIEEITKEKTIKILYNMGTNYSLWQNYMSRSDDRPSSHLIGKNSEVLY